MKKNRSKIIAILAVVVLQVSMASAQGYLGIKGGMSGASARFKPTEFTTGYWGLTTFGAFYQYIGGDKFFGGIETGLNYSQKGYATMPRMESDTVYRRTINSIDLPFLWHPTIDVVKDKFRIFLNAGPYLGYHLSSSYENTSKEAGVMSSGDWEWNLARDNRWEYGLMGGGGVDIAIAPRLWFLAEFRYSWGFSDILKNPNKYDGNPFESPLSLMSVEVGLSYRVGGRWMKKRVAPATKIFTGEVPMEAANPLTDSPEPTIIK